MGDTGGMSARYSLSRVPHLPRFAWLCGVLTAVAAPPVAAQPAPAPAVAARPASARPIEVVRLRVGATLLGAKASAAWLEADNKGDAPDRLLRASTPAAGRVELHDMSMDDKGAMRMREVEGGIELPAGAAVRMKPGLGHHLMLMDLKRLLKEGDVVPFTLEFERAGKLEVKGVVDAPRGAAANRY